MQLLLNIILSASIILLIAQSFSLIYYPVKFFHIAHAVLIAFGAYLTYFFSIQIKLPLVISIVLSIAGGAIIGILIYRFIFMPIMKRGTSTLILLIASLGIFVILQNIISLVWGDTTKLIRAGNVEPGYLLWNASITGVQITTIFVTIILVIGTVVFFQFTNLGKSVRAISSNADLAVIYGVNLNRTIMISFGLGSALAAVTGILVAFETDMVPTMGFNLLLYGVVAMIIGGVGSNWGLIGGSLLLATAQNLGAYYIDSKWMDAIAYIILILFLIWKPLGFSGRRLKKVEI